MASTPEGKVKTYLKKRVAQYGGELVFVKYIGRSNCPDTRMHFRGGRVWVEKRQCFVDNAWVETKAVNANGTLSGGQEREINRLEQFGETVFVLDSIESIDHLLPAP